jgi:Na+-transporting methylmalonyl-CoA/oxaloacetate decarboxylase gamma subunit
MPNIIKDPGKGVFLIILIELVWKLGKIVRDRLKHPKQS